MLKSTPLGTHSLPPCTTAHMGSVMTHSLTHFYTFSRATSCHGCMQKITLPVQSAVLFPFTFA